MDDLDRLFALLDVISKPGVAVKNAEEMKKLKAQETANKKILKEAKAENFAAAEARKAIVGERAKAEAFESEVQSYDIETKALRKEVEASRTAALEEIDRERAAMKLRLNEQGKKVSDLTNQLKAIELSITDARARKKAAEDELNSVRMRLSA